MPEKNNTGITLVAGNTWDGRDSAKIADVVEWVAANLVKKGIKAKDAPSAEAWALFCDVRDDREFRIKTFWPHIYAKMMPSKQQLEMAQRFRDDGQVVRLVDDLTAERKAEDEERIHPPGSENNASEPSVPEEYSSESEVQRTESE